MRSEFVMLRILPVLIVVFATWLGLPDPAEAQHLERAKPSDLLAMWPSERVTGLPGEMRVVEASCRSLPMTDVRRRIVDIAVQEWAFFGFNVVDETVVRESLGGPSRSSSRRRFGRRFSWLDAEESARVADSIAGYWAITSDGAWILSRQNEVWAGPGGVASRWRDPWSAAFISWVMCESGLDRNRFRHAIAHHTYIDQAIEARDGGSLDAAFEAYDVGEESIQPGDLLCAARRPTYESLEDRRRQLGDGIRSHCDIVIKLEPENDRILAIGGNVRGMVSLKLLPAGFEAESASSEAPAARWVGRGRDRIFAHLRLRADTIEPDAFDNSPTLRQARQSPDVLDRLLARLAGETS